MNKQNNIDNTIYDTQSINSYMDFMVFLKDFSQSYQDHQNNPNNQNQDNQNNGNHWENNNLNDFLNAMLSFCEDMDGYYQNIYQQDIEDINQWQMMADILIASTMYE